MFIKSLIVLFVIFIAYLLFSNTIKEGAKGSMKVGKKGGIKKKDKKDKKDKKATTTGQNQADENEDGVADDTEGAVKKDVTNDAGEPLPTTAQLPRMVNDLQKQLQITQTQVAALSAENTKVAASSVSEEPDDELPE